MNELLLARWQFGLTSAYHFLFVPLTLGLSLIVAVMQTIYVRTGNETYKKMTKFWGNLFLINFAVGVVTGIVLVFQFGMNWSGYSRFIGDIVGVPLAIEALLAFFLESVFLGVWYFGWDKVSKNIHLLSIWLVAIASNLSALWILTANSFMQNPVSYVLTETKVELANFGGLLTNSYLWHQFPHVVLGGFCTGAFFVLGVSAYHLLRKKDTDFFKKSFQIGVILGLISIVGAGGIGHIQGQYLVKNKPMKMAAAEALWETADPAPFAVVAIIDQENMKNSWEIAVPGATSFMSYNKFSGEVKGLRDLQSEFEAKYGPGDYLPPVATIFWSFRFMIGFGSLMALLAVLGLFAYHTGRLENSRLLLKGFLWAIPLPFIVNLFGWMMAEIGRQPWVVFGLQKVNEAVSPNVSAGEIWITIIGFTIIYVLLAAADLFLMAKYAKQGPAPIDTGRESTDPGEEASLWT